jgi:hypothetical protein
MSGSVANGTLGSSRAAEVSEPSTLRGTETVLLGALRRRIGRDSAERQTTTLRWAQF